MWMEKACSSKRDAPFTSSSPTEFVMYDNFRFYEHPYSTDQESIVVSISSDKCTWVEASASCS